MRNVIFSTRICQAIEHSCQIWKPHKAGWWGSKEEGRGGARTTQEAGGLGRTCGTGARGETTEEAPWSGRGKTEKTAGAQTVPWADCICASWGVWMHEVLCEQLVALMACCTVLYHNMSDGSEKNKNILAAYCRFTTKPRHSKIWRGRASFDSSHWNNLTFAVSSRYVWAVQPSESPTREITRISEDKGVMVLVIST